MRNLTVSHTERIIELNTDYNYWMTTQYIDFEHEFDQDGDHKQIWKFNHDQITEGLTAPVKFVFNSGFKARIDYSTYHFEFPFNLRMCPANNCLWKNTGTNIASLYVYRNGTGSTDLVHHDPELLGSCPINYKLQQQPWGL